MVDILIRDVPEDAARALSEHAQASGKDRMAYIRDLLIQFASEPIVKERYAIRFYDDDTPAHGLIRRMCGDGNGIGGGPDRLTPAQMHAYEQARDLVLRNRPGDREKVIWLLKSHFDNVFEVPV